MAFYSKRDNPLLKNELSKQQRDAVARMKSSGASIREITVDDRSVSFASTSDNELRSFYVVDDRYHLVTNSLTIVSRFLAAGEGTGSLGQSKDFQLAQQ